MKKGFTLIEVLGVIVILSVIGLIVTSLIQGLVNNSSEKICEYQEKIYKKAAKNYVANNPFNVPEEITLQQLIDEGYLEKNQIKCGSVEDVIKITPNYIEEGKIKNYSYEYMPIDGNDNTEPSNQENEVYAINSNTIYKNESTLKDVGTTYTSCKETGKDVCLKYVLDENEAEGEDSTIIDIYLCQILNDKEYCFKGKENDMNQFNENVSLLKSMYGNEVETGFYTEHYASFNSDNISATVNEDGTVAIQLMNVPWGCSIDFGERSQCSETGGYIIR